MSNSKYQIILFTIHNTLNLIPECEAVISQQCSGCNGLDTSNQPFLREDRLNSAQKDRDLFAQLNPVRTSFNRVKDIEGESRMAAAFSAPLP